MVSEDGATQQEVLAIPNNNYGNFVQQPVTSDDFNLQREPYPESIILIFGLC